MPDHQVSRKTDHRRSTRLSCSTGDGTERQGMENHNEICFILCQQTQGSRAQKRPQEPMKRSEETRMIEEAENPPVDNAAALQHSGITVGNS